MGVRFSSESPETPSVQNLICPACRQSMEIADRFAGSTIGCVYCGQQMHVPCPAPPRTVAPGLDPRSENVMRRARRERHYAEWQSILGPAALCLFSFFLFVGATASAKKSVEGALYAAPAWMFLGGVLAWTFVPQRLRISAIVVATIVFGIAFFYFNSYERITVDADGRREIVTVSRWGNQPTYLRIYANDFSMYGPLSPSGKFHGYWTYIDSETFQDESWWYWYGERVTEGDFHRLNR